jgi:integral membrane sensor domain MASE1
LEDLAAFVARVEAIPASVYEGLVRNASFREDQLCSLFYLDAMDSTALVSVEALERWIARLLSRKATVRSALARRLREVLRTTARYL